MSSQGGNKAVIAALLANVGIAITKFIAFFLTGFSSMLGEAVHSLADSGNQLLLLWGGHQAKKKPDDHHQFGFGHERYIYGFLVSLVLFSLGGLFTLYEAYEKFHEVAAGEYHQSHDWKQWIPVAVLLAGILFEGSSLMTAAKQSGKSKGRRSYVQYVRDARSPELPVILMEDTAAISGLSFALIGIVLTIFTGSGYFDAGGTAMIGLLLICVAFVLAIETKSMLVGESVTPESEKRIIAAIEGTDGITEIIHMRSLHLGPEEVLVGAKIALQEGTDTVATARIIDQAEARIREAEPIARFVYLEPDVPSPDKHRQREERESDPAHPAQGGDGALDHGDRTQESRTAGTSGSSDHSDHSGI